MEIFGHYKFLVGGAFFTSLLCSVLAVLVLLANPKARRCQLAFAFNISVACWAFNYAWMMLASDPVSGLWFSRLNQLGTICLSTFFTHFALIVVDKHQKKRLLLQINYTFTFLLLILLFFSRLITESASPKIGIPFYLNPGPLYFLVPIHFFLNLIYSTYELVSGIKKLTGYRKNQLTLFLVASLIGYAAGTPGFLLVFDIPIKPVTSPLVALYPIILSYAIMKHRFLDIQKLIRNTLIFSLLFTALLLIMAGLITASKTVMNQWMNVSEALTQGIAIAVAIALYGPLKKGLSRVTNRILHQYKRDSEKIFSELTRNILHYFDLDTLSKVIVSRVGSLLAIQRTAFYVRDKTAGENFFILQSGEGAFSRNLSEAELKETAAAEEAVAAFPVLVRNRAAAYLVVGEKKSDVPWKEEEMKLLESFTGYLSLALTNVEYAEKIRFSRHQLAKSERDASAGALIAGIDHEVKNPLHTMALSLSAIRDSLKRPAEESKYPKLHDMTQKVMTSVLDDVSRVNGIIQHLSDLADRKPMQLEENLKPFEITSQAIDELKINQDTPEVVIENFIPEDLSFTCDRNVFHEMMINLVRNAWQAVGENGQITLKGWSQEGEVVIEVRDNGLGISREIQSKIFAPFYSTKNRTDQRKGSCGAGMGLFIVHQYMQALDGKIKVASSPNTGTTFSLHFPSFDSSLREAA